MSTQSPTHVQTAERTEQGGLLRAAAITGGAAIVGNLAVWAIASAAVDVPDRFTPLQPGSVVFMTVLGVLLATGAARVLAGRSARPVETFRKLIPVALVVSLIPDVLIWASDGYEGAAKAETVLPLMAMHVIAAAAVWVLLAPAARSSKR
ncbi:MAG TPA: DUF6069 family protein [Solirubrobacteraceae bacterium]|nr:DUF6069 family protein [Solirubrobacteraceae bacterium]